MAKPRFPLLEQMRADAYQRADADVRYFSDRLEVARSQLLSAWDAARRAEADRAALERAIASNVSERVRDELARGAAIALRKAINAALMARTVEDPHMINVVVPIDLRDQVPGSITQDVVAHYLKHMEVHAEVVRRRSQGPLDSDEPVSEKETTYEREFLRITIPTVASERQIIHWLDPDKPKRTP